MDANELKELHSDILKRIDGRINHFSNFWKKGDRKELFIELVFCILTPQSRARAAEKCIENLLNNDLIFKAQKWEEISSQILGVRFSRNKAKYILEARGKYMEKGDKKTLKDILLPIKKIEDKRNWIMENVKGIGMKEASHFLRNVGLGKDIAILDRHILKNLIKFEVIEKIPNLSVKNYIDIENKMKKFAKKVKIPLDHLDFVWGYKETGDIFK